MKIKKVVILKTIYKEFEIEYLNLDNLTPEPNYPNATQFLNKEMRKLRENYRTI